MLRSLQAPNGPIRRLRGVQETVLAVFVLLMSACTFPGDDRGLEGPPPCDCPHLIEAVDSINWAPDMELTTLFSETARVDGLVVSRTFRGAEADPDLLLERIRSATVEAGFVTVRDEGNRIEMSLADITLEAWTGAGGGGLDPAIVVRILYDGEDSPEVANLFEPLRRALQHG